MIQVDKVSKSYGTKQVLQPTSLHVEAGRTHALVGESGSGKSTLLRLIMGLIRARLQEVLKEIFQRLGKTVVVVTHDMSEAAYLGHCISVMREGRLLQTGELPELVRTPADPYVAEFIAAQRPRALEDASR